MRRYNFYLDSSQTNWAFSAIRSKHDYVKILLQATKVMLTPTELAENQRASVLILQIAKMSRLFFTAPSKIYSINFPFIVTEQANGDLTFRSHAHPNIDHRATSVALGLLTDVGNQPQNVLDFASLVDEATQVDPHAWNLLLDLLTLEDGYIRYDDDPSRVDGHRHPRHHLDVFYSNQTTFKLGLSDLASQPDFVDILNILTDCHYLTRPA